MTTRPGWWRFSMWAALMLLACAVLQAQSARKRPRVDPFLNGDPFALQDVLGALQAKLFPGRIANAVQNRGVSFYPSGADVKQLKDAGATDDLIALIENKGAKYKPAPPPPPKPRTAGPLTLTCAPAECNIAVDGRSEGSTQGGTKRIASLLLGPQSNVVVDFSKDGYFSEQVIVPLKAGAPTSVKPVALRPTEATEEKLGGQLFAAWIAKLGGDAGLHDAGAWSGAGSAILYQSGGQRTDWKVVARLRSAGGGAYIEMEQALSGLKWRDAINGAVVRSGGSGKLKNTAVVTEMAQIIQQIRDYQPAALAARLRSQKMTFVSLASAPDASGPVMLKATGAPGVYTLTIDSNGMLDRVAYEPAANQGKGLTVVYADYVAVGQGKAPKSLDMRFSEQTQHGITLHFDALQFAPNLTDKDFRP